MDNYTEQIIEGKPYSKHYFCIVASSLVAACGVVFVLLFINLISIGLILAVLGGFGIYFSVLSMSYEYEYIFTNGDCDVARITNKSSRKEMYSLKQEDVQRILKYTSPKFQNELDINKKLRVSDYTSGNEANKENWYAFLTNKKDKTDALVIELDDERIEYIRSIYKKKIEE